ncbi:MAG: cobalamin-dependent protein [Ignavibacteriales bacterium]|nr:cobalamin-dependent protein [Ignavibacteriales bacterium]
MKVLLVNPPVASVAAKISTPPLGLCYLASSLKAAGHEAEILDADSLDLTAAAAAEETRRRGPDAVGVTAMTPTVESAWEFIRAVRPNVPLLILGGPHVSAVGGKVFAESPVPLDAAVLGEGGDVAAFVGGAGGRPRRAHSRGVAARAGRPAGVAAGVRPGPSAVPRARLVAARGLPSSVVRRRPGYGHDHLARLPLSVHLL